MKKPTFVLPKPESKWASCEKVNTGNFRATVGSRIQKNDNSFLHIQERNFAGCDLSYLRFQNIRFAGCDFTETDMRKCRFENCTFNECDFIKSNLAYAELRDSNAVYCNFYGTDVVGCDFLRVRFDDCRFHNVLARGSVFLQCTYENCYGLRVVSGVGKSSRNVMAFWHDQGVMFKLGCFWGDAKEATQAIRAKYDVPNSPVWQVNLKDYLTVIKMLKEWSNAETTRLSFEDSDDEIPF